MIKFEFTYHVCYVWQDSNEHGFASAFTMRSKPLNKMREVQNLAAEFMLDFKKSIVVIQSWKLLNFRVRFGG